jgi:hypothetical protein
MDQAEARPMTVSFFFFETYTRGVRLGGDGDDDRPHE